MDEILKKKTFYKPHNLFTWWHLALIPNVRGRGRQTSMNLSLAYSTFQNPNQPRLYGEILFQTNKHKQTKHHKIKVHSLSKYKVLSGILIYNWDIYTITRRLRDHHSSNGRKTVRVRPGMSRASFSSRHDSTTVHRISQ